jgi:hypothetical protein
MNYRTHNISGYEISGYNMKLYCKITEYGIDTEYYKCTMSFGTGFGKFCLIASYSKQKPYEIYIERIEKRDLCVINDKLSNFEEEMDKLVKIALWTMKKMYPHVKKYTLKDNSQIYCDGDGSKDTLHMAYDYILKYNETWYQRKFNAELPGFISKHTDETNTRLTRIISKEDSLMENSYSSFSILDEPIAPLALVTDLLPSLIKYSDEYNSSETPRVFIEKLRVKYKDTYCKEVGKWLNQYMNYLNIKFFMEEWYILETSIQKPTHYSAKRLSTMNMKQKMNGGTRKKQTKYGIISECNLHRSFIGVYKDV